jgi:hypothetical protein
MTDDNLVKDTPEKRTWLKNLYFRGESFPPRLWEDAASPFIQSAMYFITFDGGRLAVNSCTMNFIGF